MYDNSNTKWFSQTLMTFKDKSYATEGYLRLSLTTNSDDLKYFNPPTLNLTISNNYQKSINLNIQNAKDLVKAFKVILPQLNGKELNIQRKYQRDTVLHFTFKVDPNNNTRIVVIEIRNNETDFTKIIIPLEGVFETLASCIREFTETYMNICTQLFIQSLQSESMQIIQQLPSLIKGVSSQIISQIPEEVEIPDSPAVDQEVEPENVIKMQATIEDLDKFLGEGMSNIDVAEFEKIEKEMPVTQEVNSMFVKYYIDNDLHNLENIMSNYFMSPSPLEAIANDIKDKIGREIDNENFTSLPGITEQDMKSLTYLSKLFSHVVYQNYLVNSVPMPASIPVLKYKPIKHDNMNIEIAYDLFLFNLYIRTARRRLENKIEDAIESKALFNTQMRFFTDPFVFSFLDMIDTKNLSSIIMTRYNHYDKMGVFNYYKELLESNRCPEITQSDISNVIVEAIEKVIGKSPYIEQLHENMIIENSLRLPTKNTLKLEQIVNEVLPLEIAEKTGANIKNKDVFADLVKKHNVSDLVVPLFVENKKTKSTTKVENKKVSNLERLVKSQYIDEVPEQHRENFMKHLSDLGDNKFDLQNTDFPIDEFGDNIIKALYLWNPESDPSIAKNYKQFYMKIEEEIMERDLILTKIKSSGDVSESSDWSFLE